MPGVMPGVKPGVKSIEMLQLELLDSLSKIY